jgi:hypothetical protein
MAGSAYLNDEIWLELEDDYNKVPIVAKDSYPDIDILLTVDPDFVHAMWTTPVRLQLLASTIVDGGCDLVIERKGENRSHCRDELHNRGIQTYLQRSTCESIEHRPVDTLERIDILDVYNEARQLVDSIEGHFQQADIVAADTNPEIPPISALWL